MLNPIEKFKRTRRDETSENTRQKFAPVNFNKPTPNRTDLAEFQCSVVDQPIDQHIVMEWPSDLGYPHLTSNQNICPP